MTEQTISEIPASFERRQSNRKKIIVDVNFEGGQAIGMASTRDICQGGLYLMTTTRFDEGTLLSLRISLGGREISLAGTVIYTDSGHGIGVRFHDVSEENAKLLKHELELA